jgi:uncharacterized protein (DUF433 family)
MRERISVRPDVHFGKPFIAGTRIPAENVLGLVREGTAPEDIRRDFYPEVSDEDVRACEDAAAPGD